MSLNLIGAASTRVAALVASCVFGADRPAGDPFCAPCSNESWRFTRLFSRRKSVVRAMGEDLLCSYVLRWDKGSSLSNVRTTTSAVSRADLVMDVSSFSDQLFFQGVPLPSKMVLTATGSMQPSPERMVVNGVW